MSLETALPTDDPEKSTEETRLVPALRYLSACVGAAEATTSRLEELEARLSPVISRRTGKGPEQEEWSGEVLPMLIGSLEYLSRRLRYNEAVIRDLAKRAEASLGCS